jgi:uncharacterized protein YndB with AHSA1/START domain
MVKNEAAAQTTRMGEKGFVVERIFDAPRGLVFKAFSEPERVARWWAPKPYQVTDCSIDLQPGGIWQYAMCSPKGKKEWIKCVFSEVVEAERIVYTARFVDENGNPIPGSPPDQQVTITFGDHGDQTIVALHFEFATSDDFKTTVDMGILPGLTMALGNLDDCLVEWQ